MTLVKGFTSFNGQIAISGAFYGGYWNDGVSKHIYCDECTTFAFRSYTVGMRFYVTPSPFPLPLKLLNPFTGLSYHFLQANYVGGVGFDGLPGRNDRMAVGTLEAGIRLVIPVANRLAVNGEARKFFRLLPKDWRRLRTAWVSTWPSVTLGISFSLR